MGYYVIMKEIEQIERAIQNKTTEWNQQLNQVYSTLSGYIECMETNTAGETAEAVCGYMKEVHQYLLDCFFRLFIEIGNRVLGYAEGYYKIEDDRNRGEAAQESLEEQIQMLAEGQTEFERIALNLANALSKISNIVGLTPPSTQSVCNGFWSTSAEADKFMNEVGTYEWMHAAGDFSIMEGMMDNIESLIREFGGKEAAEVSSYQVGSILSREEVIALMGIGQSQTAWFAENGESLREAAEAYQNRINAELREEAGRQRLIKGVLIAAAAVISAVVILGSGGSATPAVAALWNAGVVTLAGTSAIYGISEASEGLDDIRLGQAGDCVTVAGNPVRDALPEGMQNIYYIAGEGSTVVLALCTLGVGAVEIYGVSGMTGVVVEGGKLVVTAAGTHLIGEGLEELGMERSTVMLLEIGISVAIYGSLSKMQSAVENQQHVSVEIETEGGTLTRPTWRQSELDAATDFPDYNAQKSFINGEEVPYGTKGSVRPDYYKEGYSVDIKNYSIKDESGRSNLARNIEKQYYQRIKNLPKGTKQSVMIDVRGQDVSDADLSALYDDIMRRTNNEIEILFKID